MRRKKPLYRVLIHTETLSKSSRSTIADRVKRIAAYREKAASVWHLSPEPGRVIKSYRDQVRGLLGKTEHTDTGLGYPRSTVYVFRRGLAEAYIMPLDPMRRANDGYSMADALQVLRNNLKERRRRVKEEMATERTFLRRDPFSGDHITLCLTHKKPGYWINRLYEKRFHDEKRPTTNDLYNGIEVECFVPDHALLKEKLMPFAQYVNLGSDGSINPPPGYQGVEVRVLLKREEVSKLAPAILKAIRQAGGKVNASCGLHVHFDMRERPLEEVKMCYKKLYHCQNILFGMIPKTRRDNRFCARNRSADMSVDYNADTRYKAINPCAYRRYKTLEVRLHSGTLDDAKVVNWIDLIWRIMEGPPDIQRCSRSLDNFGKRFRLPNALVAYIKERTAKFAATANPIGEDNLAVEAAEYDDQPAEPDAPVPVARIEVEAPLRCSGCGHRGFHSPSCPFRALECCGRRGSDGHGRGCSRRIRSSDTPDTPRRGGLSPLREAIVAPEGREVVEWIDMPETDEVVVGMASPADERLF